MTDFLFLGSKITVDGDCSHEQKMFASWQESYDKVSVLKSRGIILLTSLYSQSCGLPSGRSHMVVRVGPLRRQSAKELMPLNCGAEDS